MKRILSVLLALVMVIGLLPMSILSASAAESTWALVTDASSLAEEDQVVIVGATVDYAMGTNQKSNNREAVAITKNDDSTIAAPDETVQIFTLKKGTKDNTFAFYTGSGYIYAASSSSNHLKTQTTLNDNGSWAISISDDGVASIVAQGTNTRNLLKFNPNNGTPIFSCYGSGQQEVSIYRLESNCAHANSTTVAAAAASCTEAGHNEYIACEDCGRDIGRENYPALGHSIVLTDSTITCEPCGLNAQLNTIAEAKAYTDTTVYYLKGIVTYISGSNVYIQDATGGVCVYFASGAAAGIAVGDEILVWGSMTVFNGLIEVNGPTAKEYQKLSSGNELPLQEVTIAELLADTTNEYLGERVIVKDVTLGTTSGNNTPVTSGDNSINIFKMPTLTGIASGDIVTVTAIVGTYNGYQLLVASADDITPCAHENTTTEGYVAPSCTEPGQTGTTTCNACGEVVAESTEIEATGHTMEDGICTVCGAKVNFALYTGGELVGSYLTFEEAWEDYDYTTYTSYIQLLADVEVTDGELQDILYLDLNGYDLSGTINADGYMVCVMDSTTNEYNGDNVGYLNVDFGEDAVASQWTTSVEAFGEAMNFMAITDENGTSFHRYYVGITHTSLNTAKKGVGYKAMFCGDDAVKALLDAEQAFGYTLTLEGGRTVSRWMTAAQLTSGKPVTLRVNNYDIANFGEAKLSAYVSINLNGEEITSAVHELTMHEMMDTINANYAIYDETQLAAIADMIAADETLQSWCLYNIGGLPYMTKQQIVDTVEAMESGSTLGVDLTWTGTITEISSAYNSSYSNISVIIQVEGIDVTLECYRMAGDGINMIRVGDEITVTGKLANYKGAAQFNAGCAMTAYTSNYVTPETAVELVDDAYALTAGTQLPGTHTLTGVITSVDTAYNASYGNVTVTIAVEGCEAKTIQCYRLKGTGADVIAAGDTITVTGTLMNYNGAVQFGAGSNLDSYVQTLTAAEIVANAYALETGAAMSECHFLTGVVASVDGAYDEATGTVTLTITCENQTIKCVALNGYGANQAKAGDTVTILGRLSNIDDVIGFNNGCFLYTYAPVDDGSGSESALVATFTMGENGDASHKDGTSKTEYTETVNGYTLTITNGVKFYTGALDATGNSCLKLGTTSAVGSFSFTVADDVTSVVIYVAKYKANTTKVSVNGGAAQTISTASNSGEYTAIEIDTTTNKTVTFTTVSGGVRAMINTIEFYAPSTEG